VAENAPDEFVDTLDGVVGRVEVSSLIVMVELATKPTPDTVTVEPIMPWVEESVIEVATTVNVVDCVVVPSVTEIVWLPTDALLGTVILALNVPVPEDVTLDGVVAMLVLSNLIVIALLAPKLVPVTVTTLLGPPEVTESVIPDTTTLNVADALFVSSVADIVWEPIDALLGIVIVAENVPVFVDVTVLGFVVILLLSNFIVMVLLTPKFEPETVTAVPVVPLVGERVIAGDGAVTVNDLLTELAPSFTVIVWEPTDALLGIVIASVKSPNEFVVTCSNN
jgi:hypothetical protein